MLAIALVCVVITFTLRRGFTALGTNDLGNGLEPLSHPHQSMSTAPFSSRREVLDLFQARLENTHQSLVEDVELEFGQNMLKTHLIESNISPSKLFETYEPITQVEEIDADLYLVAVEAAFGTGSVFLDTLDDRFWRLFSMEDSTFTKTLINKMLSREGSGLDRLWLPSNQVEQIIEMGEFEGVGMSYDADDVFPDEFIEDNLLFGDLSVNTSGHGAQRLYSLLRESDDIKKFLSLSNVQIRREVDGEFVRERITNDGGFTTRGGANIQVQTVDQIKRRYAAVVDAIEANHRLHASSREHGVRPKGKPAVIGFTEPIEDIDGFLDHIVNARDPFRLWGHTQQLDSDYYQVDGVDMHNGDAVSIELTPEWMRLYLHEDACGNTVLRIFTNLQHHYDPSAKLVIDDV